MKQAFFLRSCPVFGPGFGPNMFLTTVKPAAGAGFSVRAEGLEPVFRWCTRFLCIRFHWKSAKNE